MFEPEEAALAQRLEAAEEAAEEAALGHEAELDGAACAHDAGLRHGLASMVHVKAEHEAGLGPGWSSLDSERTTDAFGREIPSLG